MYYKHTQKGYLIIYITILILALFIYILAEVQFEIVELIIMLIAIAVLSSFLSLHVKVDETYLKLKFGYGLFKKKFLLTDIISAKEVKNKWYYGWGIKYWPIRNMWIYNVSGFDAVEIELKSGSVKRIGTDDPIGLADAIRQSIKKRR